MTGLIHEVLHYRIYLVFKKDRMQLLTVSGSPGIEMIGYQGRESDGDLVLQDYANGIKKIYHFSVITRTTANKAFPLTAEDGTTKLIDPIGFLNDNKDDEHYYPTQEFIKDFCKFYQISKPISYKGKKIPVTPVITLDRKVLYLNRELNGGN